MVITRRIVLKMLGIGALMTIFLGRSQALTASLNRRALVIYHSRTGNTKIMAAEIAERIGIALVRIQAPDYGDDFMGWGRANHDAWNKSPAKIIVPSLDLTSYDWIFLGSPICGGTDPRRLCGVSLRASISLARK